MGVQVKKQRWFLRILPFFFTFENTWAWSQRKQKAHSSPYRMSSFDMQTKLNQSITCNLCEVRLLFFHLSFSTSPLEKLGGVFLFLAQSTQSISVHVKHCLKAKCVWLLFTLWGMESASARVVTSVSSHCYIKQTLHISPIWGGGSFFELFIELAVLCVVFLPWSALPMQEISKCLLKEISVHFYNIAALDLAIVHFMVGNEPLKYSTGFAEQMDETL